jgi:hypothetical protein
MITSCLCVCACALISFTPINRYSSNFLYIIPLEAYPTSGYHLSFAKLQTWDFNLILLFNFHII